MWLWLQSSGVVVEGNPLACSSSFRNVAVEGDEGAKRVRDSLFQGWENLQHGPRQVLIETTQGRREGQLFWFRGTGRGIGICSWWLRNGGVGFWKKVRLKSFCFCFFFCELWGFWEWEGWVNGEWVCWSFEKNREGLKIGIFKIWKNHFTRKSIVRLLYSWLNFPVIGNCFVCVSRPLPQPQQLWLSAASMVGLSVVEHWVLTLSKSLTPPLGPVCLRIRASTNKVAAKAVCSGTACAIRAGEARRGGMSRRRSRAATFWMLWETELSLLNVGPFSEFSNDSNYFGVFFKNYSIQKCLSSSCLVLEKLKNIYFFRMKKDVIFKIHNWEFPLVAQK